MNTKRNKLLNKFKKLKKLDFASYKILLRSLCQDFHISEINLNNLVDKLVKPEYSNDFEKVLKKVSNEIMLIEIYLKFVEDLENEKNNDQGLTL